MKPVRTIRRETGLVEAVCEHNIGHPVHGSVDWMRLVTGDSTWGIHGCDGCCAEVEWKLSTLQESVRIANQIILDQQNYIKQQNEKFDEVADKIRRQRDSAWSDLAAINLRDSHIEEG